MADPSQGGPARPKAGRVPPPPTLGASAPGSAIPDFDIGDVSAPIAVRKPTDAPARGTAIDAFVAVDEDAPTLAFDGDLEGGDADELAREVAALRRAAGITPIPAKQGRGAAPVAQGSGTLAFTPTAPGTDARVPEAEPGAPELTEIRESSIPEERAATRLPAPRGRVLARESSGPRRTASGPRPVLGSGMVPSGVVPSSGMGSAGVPEPVSPEDTDVLIDAVAAELEADALRRETRAAVPAGVARGREPSVVVHVPTVESEPARARRWWPFAVAAAVLLIVVVRWSRDDAGEGTTDPKVAGAPLPGATGANMTAEPGPAPVPAVMPSRAAAQLEAAKEPEAAPEAAGEPELVAALDTPPIGEPIAEDAEAEPVIEPEPAIVEDAAPEPEADRGSSRGRSKRGNKSKSDAAAPAAAASAKSSGGGESAASLLSQARAAYKSGQGKSAYTLAAKSAKLKSSMDATELMAKASCMKKDKDRAKYLFKSLPFGRRAGVRNACKTHGVKLGV